MPPATKIHLAQMLKSKNVYSDPNWSNYTDTMTELSSFLTDFDINCDSNQWKHDFTKSLSSLIFDNIVQAHFDNRVQKKDKLALDILKNINNITGEQVSSNNEPENFLQGVQILVANVLSPWLKKYTSNDSQNNKSRKKGLKKLHFQNDKKTKEVEQLKKKVLSKPKSDKPKGKSKSNKVIQKKSGNKNKKSFISVYGIPSPKLKMSTKKKDGVLQSNTSSHLSSFEHDPTDNKKPTKTKLKTKYLKESSSISRKSIQNSKLKLQKKTKHRKLKNTTVNSKTKNLKTSALRKSKLVSKRKKKSNVKKIKSQHKLPDESNQAFQMHDDTIMVSSRPTNEILLKSISNITFLKTENKDEMDTRSIQKANSTSEHLNVNKNVLNDYQEYNTVQDNEKNDIGENFIVDKTNVSQNISVHDKENDDKLTLTSTTYDNENMGIEQNSQDDKLNINKNIHIVDQKTNQLSNIVQDNSNTDIRQISINEETNVNESRTVDDKDYHILTDTVRHDEEKDIQQNLMDEKTNVNEDRTVYDKDLNEQTDTVQDENRIDIDTISMDEKPIVNENNRTVHDKEYNELTKTIQDKNKTDTSQNSTVEKPNVDESRTVFDKDYNKLNNTYPNNNMKTNESNKRPLQPLNSITEDKQITDKKITATKKIKNNIYKSHVKTSEYLKTKYDEGSKSEKKFKSRILDDKLFWNKLSPIKRFSTDFIGNFKDKESKVTANNRLAVKEYNNKSMMEYEKIRKNPGIIYQIRKKNGSDFSLYKTILPLYEVKDSANNKNSAYHNDIRLTKLCGNIHPIITGPPVQKETKLLLKPEDIEIWEHNFDKCICQNKLTKKCSNEDEIDKAKYSTCKI